MPRLNRAEYIGRLGHDVEIRSTQSGTDVGRSSIAVDNSYKGNESTLWVKLVFWGAQAERAAQYCKKGSMVFVEGRTDLREWEKKDGSGKGYSLELHVNNWQLLSGGRDKDAEADSAFMDTVRSPEPEPAAKDDDELPF